MYARCAAKGWWFHVDELVMQDNTSQMDGAKPWGRRNGCMYHVSPTYLIKRPRSVAARQGVQGETRKRLASRMEKVVNHMNSEEFHARDGGDIYSLAQGMREWCRRVVALDGERLRA